MVWESGVYEHGSVYGLRISICGCLWVGKRVFISMESV